MSLVKKAVNAAVAYLLSTKARPAEIAIALGIYEAVRAALGSA